jgi:outer membrane biosynthesis protein TonB
MIQDSLPVSVDVKVSINAEGKVGMASAINVSTMAQRILSPSAIQAAMLWRFQPARRDGKPVPSETILKFEFERPAR